MLLLYKWNQFYILVKTAKNIYSQYKILQRVRVKSLNLNLFRIRKPSLQK